MVATGVVVAYRGRPSLVLLVYFSLYVLLGLAEELLFGRRRRAAARARRSVIAPVGPESDPDEPLLHSVVIYLDELAFVVPPSHPLASAKQVGISHLGAESFVAHIVPSPYREKVIQTFRRHKTPLHMDVELPTLQAIKSYIVMGNGVALVPEIAVEGELARGELVRIPVRELLLHRKLRLIYRKQASLSHAARAFLTVAEATAAERKGRYRFQAEH